MRVRAGVAPDRLWIAALVVGLPLLAALLLGVDANWDLRNYHLYNPHAWLSGRWAIDVAPAQLQSWHNPLLDVPYYLAIHSRIDPRWASAWLAVPTMLSMWLLLRMQGLLSPEAPSRASQLVLVLLALTGAAGYATLGTSTNDAFVGAGILASLMLALSAQAGAGLRYWIGAGLLAGAVAGLKLSAAFYCIALAIAALVPGPWAWRGRVARLSALAIGGIAGFALAYGYWAVRLYKLFGNPFFPYFNNVFRSPHALPLSFADARFRPESVFEALASPVRLVSRGHRFSELDLNDPRLLLGIVSLAVLCLLARRVSRPAREGVAMLFAFVVVSWLLWVFQYGIYRYAIALELLGALAIVLLVQRLPRWRSVALLAALLLVSADTRRPDLGRLHTAPPMLGIPQVPLEPDAMVVGVGLEPVAYIALGMPDRVPLVSVGSWLLLPPDCTGLQAQASQAIRAHTGPLWLLRPTEPGTQDGAALVSERYGLKATGGVCKELTGPLGRLLLCPVSHGPSNGTACDATSSAARAP
jgi:hypothetical protein